ncbi:MAG: acyl-CoA thioester hydrolase/BAAT C-terminal domain-containing protein [Myxococcota bacterium]|nr:acyl-CoA thioester hydrolase/BAAT C-terminal domain-containing protein [Myxococcota bacterium]
MLWFIWSLGCINQVFQKDFQCEELESSSIIISENYILTPHEQVVEKIERLGIVREKAPLPGYLYRPDDDRSHPSILLLHGLEGGNGDFRYEKGKKPTQTGENAWVPVLARYLASQGYVTYALCYFDCGHHLEFENHPPDELIGIDLKEHFLPAMRALRSAPYSKGEKMAFWGTSRGGELALVLGSILSKHGQSLGVGLPHLVLAHSPPDYIASGFSKKTAAAIIAGKTPEWDLKPAWMLDHFVPAMGDVIPIEDYEGPILVTYGAKDEVWPPSVKPTNLQRRYTEKKKSAGFLSYQNKNDRKEAFMNLCDGQQKRMFVEYADEGHYLTPKSESDYLNNALTIAFLKKYL